MRLLRHKTLLAVLYLLVAAPIALAQIEHPIEKAIESAVEKEGKPAAEKAADDTAGQIRKANEDWQKYHEEQKKFYERYATADREYFGWFSATDLKKPFNQLVDDAIVSVRAKSEAKVFKNAGNQQIVEILAAESQALPPPDRLNLQLQESWYKPDTLEVSKSGSSDSASVRMGSLKDYISDAIDRLTYPPKDPSKIVVHPNQGAQKLQVVH